MKSILLLAGLCVCFLVEAQLPVADSIGVKNDSLVLNPTTTPADNFSQIAVRDSVRPVLRHSFTSDSFLYTKRLFFSFTNPIRYTISEKTWQGKEAIFYSVMALLIGFALLKNIFGRYVSDLFSSYFRTTLRQRQVKEQLAQNPLPSLLFNIFFIFSAALFSALLLQHFQVGIQYAVELLALYGAIGLSLIYGGKFLLLKFFGWVFQMADTTETYIFIVFSTNKILGICLLPFTILLAFTYNGVNATAITISFIIVGGLFAYRYFLSYLSVNQTVRLNFFHFLLYLAAFEVLPLLLINKLLFGFLSEI